MKASDGVIHNRASTVSSTVGWDRAADPLGSSTVTPQATRSSARFEALPERLRSRLGGELRRHMGAVHRREAEPRVCGRCGAVVLAGLDDEPCGVAAVADLAPLGLAGEAGALLAGRRTYTLGGIFLFIITRRGPWDISRPRKPETVVLAEHRCGQPVPPEWSE